MEVNVPTTVLGSPSGTSIVSNLTSTANTANVLEPGARNPAGRSSGTQVTTDERRSLEETIVALNEQDELGGDGGDSDVEGLELDLHGGKELDTREKDVALEDAIVPDIEGDVKGFLRVSAAGTADFIGEIGENSSNLEINKNIFLPKPPVDYVVPQLKDGEPPFNLVDNPGGWDRFYFQPKWTKSKQGIKKYAGHYLPTGAIPVPVGPDGSRKCGAWEFHYKGFDNGNSTSYRRGATTSNLFPKEMEGALDAEILEKLGLTEKRMKEVDPLFFFQLLLPFCDTSKSGIPNDPRKSYYTECSKFTNSYAYLQGQGSDYGHVWKNTSAAELLHFDGVLFHDGTLGGSNGALYRRWDKSNDCYSKNIAEAITVTRYAEVKRNLKLCNNSECPKRGQPGYDPGYKYDLIWRCIVDNTNAISKKADETQVIDESTWGHAGFGETGTGITGRLRNKKVAKGGQTVLMMDRHRMRIRAYMHRSKIYNELHKSTKTSEWKANGPYELKHMVDELASMVDGSDGNKKKLFRRKPCVTADNYFQNDKIMEYIGQKGFGCISTSARNALPKDIKSEYLQKEKTCPRSKQAKVARFAHPILAVKNAADGSYQRIHISFQSTSSCNISTVNAMNEVSNFCELRERGRGNNKRYWVIEMNHGRRIYLSSYNGIDVLDHLLKNARLFYMTWKYWHAPKNHALAIAITCAYDIYIECAEGKLKIEWKVEKPISSWEFQRRLGKQALTYVPKKCMYPGDELLRSSTVIPRARRANEQSVEGNISRTQLQILKDDDKSRACGDLDKMCCHIESIIRIPKGRSCAYCGEKAYHACGVCKDEGGRPTALHVQRKKGKVVEMCYFHYHNDNQLGLAREDQIAYRKRKRSDWEPPTSKEREENREAINTLKDRFR